VLCAAAAPRCALHCRTTRIAAQLREHGKCISTMRGRAAARPLAGGRSVPVEAGSGQARQRQRQGHEVKNVAPQTCVLRGYRSRGLGRGADDNGVVLIRYCGSRWQCTSSERVLDTAAWIAGRVCKHIRPAGFDVRARDSRPTEFASASTSVAILSRRDSASRLLLPQRGAAADRRRGRSRGRAAAHPHAGGRGVPVEAGSGQTRQRQCQVRGRSAIEAAPGCGGIRHCAVPLFRCKLLLQGELAVNLVVLPAWSLLR
jgi:hypothetical protein